MNVKIQLSFKASVEACLVLQNTKLTGLKAAEECAGCFAGICMTLFHSNETLLTCGSRKQTQIGSLWPNALNQIQQAYSLSIHCCFSVTLDCLRNLIN